METNARETIESFVKGAPGASTRMVARALGMDDSTADYHLRRMRKEARVGMERSGREVTWWPVGGSFCPVLRVLIPLLRREGAEETALALDDWPSTAIHLSLRSGAPIHRIRAGTGYLLRAGVAARSRRGRVVLAPGAQRCITMGRAGKACDQWGTCEMSRRMLEKAGRTGAAR